MIRENVPVECWNFVSGSDNPADLATRTNTSLANFCGEKWFHGSLFLQLPESEWPTLGETVENSRDIAFSEEGGDINVLLNSVSLEEGIGKVITTEIFSCFKKLLRVTGYVLRFRNLRRCLDGKEKVIGELVSEDLEESKRLGLIRELTFVVNFCSGQFIVYSSFEKLKVSLNFPAGIYLLKVNNRNARTRCEICSKLTIKTPERRLASFWCLYC